MHQETTLGTHAGLGIHTTKHNTRALARTLGCYMNKHQVFLLHRKLIHTEKNSVYRNRGFRRLNERGLRAHDASSGTTQA